MKLLTFRHQSTSHLGIADGDRFLSLTAIGRWHQSIFKDKKQLAHYTNSMEAFIEGGKKSFGYAADLIAFYQANEEEDSPEKVSFVLEEIKIAAPLTRPEKIICVGLNYLDHCRETGLEPPKSPVVFSKYANAIIGSNEAILLPVNSQEVDFEAELAVVIGSEAKCVTEEGAESCIFGYTIMNDVSARDLQFADGQWMRGKTADTFAPIGPVITTKEAIANPHQLDISLSLNGEIMQQSNTKNLIFRIPYIISFLSQSMTLKPGDIIATGTPPGVGMGREPKVWLKNGDNVAISIEGIGTLSNKVAAETRRMANV